jgi:hypothetical protein
MRKTKPSGSTTTEASVAYVIAANQLTKEPEVSAEVIARCTQ